MMLQGILCAEQDVNSSATAGEGDAVTVHCCFGLKKHAMGTLLAFAVRLLAAVAVKSH